MDKEKTKIEECTICSYKTKCKKVDWVGQNNIHFKGYICDVCANNYFTQMVYLYPSQHLEDGNIIKMIAWGINYLKDNLKKQ